jgi:uncharacterized membrane protein
MLTVEESIVINRPRKELWDYFVEPANFPAWQSNTIEFDTDWDTEPQVGDRVRHVVKLAGRKIRSVREVTEVTQGERISWTTVEGPFSSESTFSFDDADNGVRFTILGATPGLKGFFGKLGEPVVVGMFRRDLRASLEHLKTLLELNAEGQVGA